MLSLILAVSTLLTSWQFRQEVSEQMPDVDTTWHEVRVPHDWAIRGAFDRKNDLQEVIVVQNGESEPTWKTGRSGGLPWMGKGHYKTTVPVKKGKCYTIVFDGAMSHAHVLVNGKEIAYWPYGYNTFDCVIPQEMIEEAARRQPSEVTIEVLLENKPQQSRWYPGAGLYRNVHLVESNPVHIPTFGICLRTPEVSAGQTTVEIWVELQNGAKYTTADEEGVLVNTELYYEGKHIGSIEGQHGTCNIPTPHLWSPESPNLYTARTRVYKTMDNGQWTMDNMLDERETRFGVRSISYTAEKGFQLNGQTRKFKGVCLHHDLGPLGAAVH